MPEKISSRTIGRLSVYRRLLLNLQRDRQEAVYSHQLAAAAGVSAAQVRRDVMAVGYTGSPVSGYNVEALTESISRLIDAPAGEGAVLVGVGNLGRAVLAYLAGRRPKLHVAAAFDADPDKAGRVIHGVRCHADEELTGYVRQNAVRVAIVTVPAEAAQGVADTLVSAGVTGLLNFAPAALRTPEHVYVENMDMLTTLEKVAFMARSADQARATT